MFVMDSISLILFLLWKSAALLKLRLFRGCALLRFDAGDSLLLGRSRHIGIVLNRLDLRIERLLLLHRSWSSRSLAASTTNKSHSECDGRRFQNLQRMEVPVCCGSYKFHKGFLPCPKNAPGLWVKSPGARGGGLTCISFPQRLALPIA